MLEELKKLVEKHNLIERSNSYFDNCFKNYKIENQIEFKELFGDFQEEKLQIWFDSILYKVNNWPNCDYEYVVVNMLITYNEKIIGYYNVDYNMAGECEDDSFVLH